MAKLRPSEREILAALFRAEGRELSFREIAILTGRSDPVVSENLRRLQSLYLIRHEADVTYEPTVKGVASTHKVYRLVGTGSVELFLSEASEFLNEANHGIFQSSLIVTKADPKTFLDLRYGRLGDYLNEFTPIFSERWQRHKLETYSPKGRETYERYKKTLHLYLNQFVKTSKEEPKSPIDEELFAALAHDLNSVENILARRLNDPSEMFVGLGKEPDDNKVKQLKRFLYNARNRKLYEDVEKLPPSLLVVPLSGFSLDKGLLAELAGVGTKS